MSEGKQGPWWEFLFAGFASSSKWRRWGYIAGWITVIAVVLGVCVAAVALGP